MTNQKQNCHHFVNLLQIKKVHCISIHTLNSVLGWSTFTVSSLFEYDATSFAHLHLAIIGYSSPHLFSSQAVRLDGGRRTFSGFSRNISRKYMLLWTFYAAEFFSELFPRCVAWHNPVILFFTSGLGFCSDIQYQLLDLLLRRVCLSKSCPFNWICHRLTSLEV